VEKTKKKTTKKMKMTEEENNEICVEKLKALWKGLL
jgi:hypothetical protein